MDRNSQDTDLSLISRFTIPCSIWETSFTWTNNPHSGSDTIQLDKPLHDHITELVRNMNSHEWLSTREFSFEAPTISALADQILDKVDECAQLDDFSTLLALDPSVFVYVISCFSFLITNVSHLVVLGRNNQMDLVFFEKDWHMHLQNFLLPMEAMFYHDMTIQSRCKHQDISVAFPFIPIDFVVQRCLERSALL